MAGNDDLKKVFENLMERKRSSPECQRRSGLKRDKARFVAPRNKPGHGTTVIILFNAWGVFIISDGLVFSANVDFSMEEYTEVGGEATDWDQKKTYILGGGRLIVTGAGDLPWVYSIIDHLKLVAHNQEWTALQCAKFAKFHMTSGFGHHPRYNDLSGNCMKKLIAKMVFVTFEDGSPSVWYADKDEVKEIVRDTRYEEGSEEWHRNVGFNGYKCLGTGSCYVDQVFTSKTPNHGKSLQESMLTLLKLMDVAVDWDEDTGGTMHIYHMNQAGDIKVVPPFDESEIKTFIAELGGEPFDYEYKSD